MTSHAAMAKRAEPLDSRSLCVLSELCVDGPVFRRAASSCLRRGLRNQLAGWTVAVILAVLGFTARAAASLGGDLGSIQTDQVRLQGAVMRVTSGDAFTVHEMRASTGTTVREYVSTSGKVFGVAWDGPTVPDLRQVLGVYFPAYIEAAQAAQKKRLGHGPIRIEAPTFVVEQSGHPRAFAGRAYVPQFVPAGIGAEIVR